MADETSTTETDNQKDLRCGCGPVKPSWVQRACNNPKVFTAWLCWYSLIQGFVVNGINNVNVSTLERRYNLPSQQVSLISSIYDISAGLFVLPITYWGYHYHQPRLIAIGALVMSLGSFVMALPQWTTDVYQLGNTIADRCNPLANITAHCIESSGDDGLSNYLYVFLLGQFLHGIGGTILYSLGIVFIDSHVKTNDSPAYQGVMYSFSTLGPALGYILGGQLLSIYVDAGRVDLDTINISEEDPRYVGAWWIGFLCTGCLFLTVFLALIPYPRELPQRKAIESERVSQAHQNGSEDIAGKEGFGRSIKDLPIALKLVLTNPVSVFVACAGISEGIITSGFATFMPKFIQNQYGQTAGTAAMLGGGLAVPGAAGGQLLGGVICKLGKLKIRGMLRFCIGLSVVSVVLAVCCLARCSSENVAGVIVPYFKPDSKVETVDLLHSCNSNCGCTAESFEPICGRDGIQYFSPCHAGCTADMEESGTKVYSNCSCISPSLTVTDWPYSIDAMATEGKCSLNCSMMYVFLPFFFLVILTTFMASVPGVTMTMRCLPDSQRAFGLGVKWTFVRFLGMVPGPIIYGSLFDSTCLLWQDKCGSQGSCWVYDNDVLSIRILIAVVCLKIASLFFFTMAHLCYKPPAKELEKDKGEEVTGSELTTPAADKVAGYDNPQYVSDQ